jgi:hypothetical protein
MAAKEGRNCSPANLKRLIGVGQKSASVFRHMQALQPGGNCAAIPPYFGSHARLLLRSNRQNRGIQLRQ